MRVNELITLFTPYSKDSKEGHNMERPPESLKPFANRIAKVACTEDSAQMVRLLRLSGLPGAGGNLPIKNVTEIDEVGDRFGPPQNPDHIGIWERKVENGKPCFVRRMEMMQEWEYWSNLGRIEAKGPKRRVVLIGESVARGYLYDPAFTPAIALEMILAPHFSDDGIEVIDLARSNLSHEVRELAIAALQLEPDLVVIFSGNNWGVAFPGAYDIAKLDEALSKEGISGAKRTGEEQIARTARRIVNDVATAYELKGVPLVWIVPEFNLGDWRDPITNAPHLAEGLNREWLKLLEDAQRALAAGDSVKAGELAEKLVEIDQGVCVAGFYILAECCRHQNDLDGERKYLELARDSVSWDSSRMVLPRTYSTSQKVLREEPLKYKNQIVDLPVLFKEYLNGEIPGRRLLIDYCHLSSEGIRLAMSATASCVLRALKGVETPWYALAEEHIAPSRETEAEASFLAAVHNAHWWQSYDLVRHYCSLALRLSPHVAEVMLNYIDLQTLHSTQMLMTESEELISRLGSPLMRHYLLRLNEKRLDKLLLDAIVEALEEAGFAARERLDRLRREEHSLAIRETNLLDYYYVSAAQQPQELAWLTRITYKTYRPHFEPKYYKAFNSTSRFVFVGEAGCPASLCLTCRLPKPAPRETKITVELNGKPQAEIDVGREWTTWDVNIAGEAVSDGLNEVTVRWPIPEFQTDEALEKVVFNLFNLWEMKFPNFYPVFGEIHSFTAARGQEVSTSFAGVEQGLEAVEA